VSHHCIEIVVNGASATASARRHINEPAAAQLPHKMGDGGTGGGYTTAVRSRRWPVPRVASSVALRVEWAGKL